MTYSYFLIENTWNISTLQIFTRKNYVYTTFQITTNQVKQSRKQILVSSILPKKQTLG